MPESQPDQMIEVLYTHPNVGTHPVRGRATKHFYGYIGGGTRLMVYQADAVAQPHYFRPIGSLPAFAPPAPPPPSKMVASLLEDEPEAPAPVVLERNTPLRGLDLGRATRFVDLLEEDGIKTLGAVLERQDELEEIKGIGPSSAKVIVSEVRKLLNA